MELQPGSAAPDFTLASHTDQKVSLAAYRGRRTVVSFLPFAFTGGWKNQVNGFRANYEEFKKLNVEILQISADTVPSLKVWAEQFSGVPFPLLSDYWPHGAVGKAYGVFNEERGMDKRSAFLLDAQGIIRWSKVYDPGTIPESKDLLEQLRNI
jgi:mycoredoxin-dependent peroxiredoxin